jgi:hypothetical protein
MTFSAEALARIKADIALIAAENPDLTIRECAHIAVETELLVHGDPDSPTPTGIIEA